MTPFLVLALAMGAVCVLSLAIVVGKEKWKGIGGGVGGVGNY